MNIMAEALLDSGVVTSQDVERAKRQEEKDAEEAEQQRVLTLKRQRRAESALKAFPGGLVAEISMFIDEYGAEMCPLEMLEAMAKKIMSQPVTQRSNRAQVEWSKWIAVLREAGKLS